MDWVPLPLDKGYFANLDEDVVVSGMTAIENGFVNEQGGHTRFPGLIERANLGNDAQVYLHDFDGDLIAGNANAQVFRIDRNFTVTNVTSTPVAGGRRIIFAKTDRELLMAAGGPIVRLRDRTTELLSENAPSASHIAWIDNFTIAVEVDSGRFFHSGAGQPDQWDPLDTFAADGNPDNINSLIVTPFRELLLGGEQSIEQFERLPTGDVPFFRRWAVGEGVKLPYAILFADNALWTINSLTEFVRFSGQTSTSQGSDVGKLLESIDDWSDAWIGGYPDRPMNILGQKFIILQAPNATNAYGSKGITLGYDYRLKRFFSLYGWDRVAGAPKRWPGWSHWTLWDRVFVGGNGKIYEVSPTTYRNGSELQRWLIRTAHVADGNEVTINKFRLRVRRGFGTPAAASEIWVRCSRDGRPFGARIKRTLGLAGERSQFLDFGNFGTGSTFMFEISSTDDCPIDLVKAEVQPIPVGH